MISASLDGTLKIGELEGLLTKRSPRISSGSLSERNQRTTRMYVRARSRAATSLTYL